MNPFDDDDVPWADPAIRADYEAALGRFVLAFNEVDYRLSKIINVVLLSRDRPDLATSAARGAFAQRLETLDLLRSSTENGELSALPLARLRVLNSDRNQLAHGHFDQNPFDGSYTLLLSAKTRNFPIMRVAELASELAAIAEQFRFTELAYQFDDLSDECGMSD
jgi:hypothetical protein